MPEGNVTARQTLEEKTPDNTNASVPEPTLKENSLAPIETGVIPHAVVTLASHSIQITTATNTTDATIFFHTGESYEQVNTKGWTPDTVAILLKLSDQLACRPPPPKISPTSPYTDEDVFMAKHPNLPDEPSTPKKPMTMKSAEAARARAYPTTFLVYNLSQKAANTLIDKQIWSAEHITFQTLSLNMNIPFLLFTLVGFTTNDP
ncbi:hypothetical protein HETIRDRAFT_105958 [Heterobasidion irregulare TC 32-1]|uniref:Uncharacterized protein n=1 Tax=Heterobasidion irregulare (strain TC 32-1) TaxID=747525 RepID=W4JSR0_HETIT|nr:uncharacterized protein HETIRDRAFT_105958 [Heterobasidion irregulare TC 32-1]ETW76494.1 hypothetical protein HETIRDRAFT_105958 [Heterobasidion irregulare TC 32-1]